MKHIVIGGAWPYANGSLHIGHIAGLLPGDILARYHRLRGDAVYYVSGSDCHGTPVSIRARAEGTTPEAISERFHAEFVEVFTALGFSYDLYTKTSSEAHKQFVQDFHKQLYRSPYVYEKDVKQAFCPTCTRVLTDRLILGRCPNCQEATRGDQCDHCGEILEAGEILEPTCADCGAALRLIDSRDLFIAISKLEPELRHLLADRPHWRKNAIAFTKRYQDEGLRDRALTRELDWGIEVPYPGYEDKRIYIWAENVLGYLSACKLLADERGSSLDEIWGENAWHYYVHGKDNIPFHTIILPSLLLGHGGGYRLPDEIISSEHLQLEGKKISTSQNWAIWVKDLIGSYHPDALRYFFVANGPEKRDTDFSWHEFLERNNNELLGAYGNFVNRTLVFVEKYFDSLIGENTGEGSIRIDAKLESEISELYIEVGRLIEGGHFKDALATVFSYVRRANQYFDRQEPWTTRTTNPAACRQTLFDCVQIIANLALILEPFLPQSSATIIEWFGLERRWTLQQVPSGYKLPPVHILFLRLDKSIVGEELAKLGV